MKNLDLLFDYAVKDVWANPHADRHATIKLVRLTRSSGAIKNIETPIGCWNMPTPTDRYHLYVYTTEDPIKFGLQDEITGWRTLSDIWENTNTQVDVFSKGRMCLHDTVYLGQSTAGYILVAVKLAETNLSIISNDVDPVYLRFYTNGNPEPDVFGGDKHRIFRQANGFTGYNAFRQFITNYETNFGLKPNVYYNGFWIDFVDVPATYSNLLPGDVIELLVDINGQLPAHQEYVIDDLPAFTSTVDSVNKLIVSYEDDVEFTNTYVDDKDVWVVGYDAIRDMNIGLYFPRLFHKDMRKLTDKDFSIHAGRVEATGISLQQQWGANPLTDLRIVVFDKWTHLNDLLIQDKHRTRDLMNLPKAIRHQALVGVNATMDIWKAQNLETAPLNIWQDSENKDIVPANIVDVFTRKSALMVLQMFEQDEVSGADVMAPRFADGRLARLLAFQGQLGARYPGPITGETVTLIRNQIMTPTTDIPDLYLPEKRVFTGPEEVVPEDVIPPVPPGQLTPVIISNKYDFLAYYDDNGLPELAIQDTHYVLTTPAPGKVGIAWDPSVTGFTKYVRTADYRFEWREDRTPTEVKDGIDIWKRTTYPNADPLNVSAKNIYVWRDGDFAIEGLDYVIKDGKIFTQSILLPVGGVTEYEVLIVGLPDKELKRIPKGMWGWMVYGKMSYNDKYNFARYRHNMFFANGKSIYPLTYASSEEYSDETPSGAIAALPDGTPYAVVPRPQFVKDADLDSICDSEIYENNLDKQLEDYLTTIYPQPQETGLVTLASKYDLVSIFMEKLIDEIVANNLDILDPDPDDSYINAKVAAYLYWYDIDVTQQDHDMNFVEIHPMRDQAGATVNVIEYNFLTRVNELMLGDQVTGLNLYLTIVP